MPKRLEGIALPLRDGELRGAVVGDMTIHGRTAEVRFEVSGGLRDGELTVTATNAPAWRFADFGLEIPRVLSVVSIVDEIRLEVRLVAARA